MADVTLTFEVYAVSKAGYLAGKDFTQLFGDAYDGFRFDTDTTDVNLETRDITYPDTGVDITQPDQIRVLDPRDPFTPASEVERIEFTELTYIDASGASVVQTIAVLFSSDPFDGFVYIVPFDPVSGTFGPPDGIQTTDENGDLIGFGVQQPFATTYSEAAEAADESNVDDVPTQYNGQDFPTQIVFDAGGNTAPEFSSGAEFSVDENTTAVGTVAANDVDNDTVTFAIVPGADGNLFDIDAASGELVFLNAPDFEDPQDGGGDNDYLITVSATDGTDTTEQTITVTVTDENEAPIVAAIDQTFTEDDDPIEVDLLAGASDPEGETLSVTDFDIQASDGRAISFDVDPVTSVLGVQPTPFQDLKQGEEVVLTATYLVSDGENDTSNTANVTITGVNDAPTANDDSYFGVEDQTLTADVSPAASDAEGDQLTFTVLDDVNFGSLTLDVDGSFIYSPNADYNRDDGLDTFVYEVSDGGTETATATATINIEPVNDRPVAVNDTVTAAEDGTITIDVLANDTDVDSTLLQLKNRGVPSNGSIGVDGNLIIYTPDANFNGTDAFTYNIDDEVIGNTSNLATVSVVVTPVNDAPETTPIERELSEDDDPIEINLLEGASDVENDDLTVTNFSIIASDERAVDIDPTGNLLGIDPTPFQDLMEGEVLLLTASYLVSDGQDSTPNTATVTVTGVNDAPEVAPIQRNITEDDTVQIDLLEGASDAEGDTLTVTNFSIVASDNRDLDLNPTDNFLGIQPTPFQDLKEGEELDLVATYLVSDGDKSTENTATVTITGINDAPETTLIERTLSENDDPIEIDLLEGAFDVEGDELTVTNFSIIASDGRELNSDSVDQTGNLLGVEPTPFQDLKQGEELDLVATYLVGDGDKSTENTATVTITGVNDAPVASDDSADTDEDNAVVVDVLVNDTDAEDDDLSVTEASDGSIGTTTANADGTITYTPNLNANGVDTFTYVVADVSGETSSATVSVNISPVQDAPVALDDEVSVSEDGTVTVDALANDFDVDDEPLAIASAVSAQGEASIDANGDIVFIPDADFAGQATIEYVIQDQLPLGEPGNEATATVTVTVDPINDDPIANNDSGFSTPFQTAITIDPLALLANDDDGDPEADQALQLIGVFNGDGGNVSFIDGEIEFVPDDTFSGAATFEYRISDGQGGTAVGTVTVAVGENADPVAEDDNASTTEDTAVAVPILDNDSDADGDELTVSLTEPDNGSFEFDGEEFFYTPDKDFNGTEIFTYSVSDGRGGADIATVTINVEAVNDAPLAVDDEFTTTEDTSITVDVLFNDIDVDDATLTLGAFGTPGDGGLNQVGDLLVYTPDADFAGRDEFTYTVTDAAGLDNVGTVTINVTPVNDPPDAVDDTVTVQEDGTLTIDVLQNDTDVEGDALTVTSFSDASEGVVTPLGNQFVYTPDENFNGSDTFTYSIDDGNGGTDLATVTINVAATNDDPVANDDTAFVVEDGTVTINVLDNDTDVDGDSLTILSVTEGPNGSVDVLSNELLFTPDPDFNGTETFTYRIGDGQGGVDEATVTVTVEAVDEPTGSIAGRYFEDVNGDGQDDEEPGFEGVSVSLFSDGNLIATQLTDGDGNYIFDNVLVGEYQVSFDTPPGGFEFTEKDVGNDATDSDVDDNGLTDVLVLQADQLITGVSAGARDPATGTIDGRLFLDDNKNNLDDLEPGANDFEVSLTDAAGNLIATTTTDPGGLYRFENLLAGDYRIVVPLTGVGTSLVAKDVGADDSVDSDVDPSTGQSDIISLAVGETVAEVDAGYALDNRPPVANDDQFEVNENSTENFLNVLDNDTDPDINDTIIIVGETDGTNGIVDLVEGDIFYTPDPDFFGTDQFSYRIEDAEGLSSIATVTVTVNEVPDTDPNQPPVVLGAGFTIDENSTDVGTVQAEDPDNDPVKFSISGGQDQALFTINEDTGALAFIDAPDFEDPGDSDEDNLYKIEVSAFDGEFFSDPTIIEILVEDVDEEPELLLVEGFDGPDVLIGTAENELFRSKGGVVDQSFLGGGADVFEFGDEVFNGVREVDYIIGFGEDDLLDLGGADIASEINAGPSTYLLLSGDGDVVVLLGVPDFDESQVIVSDAVL